MTEALQLSRNHLVYALGTGHPALLASRPWLRWSHTKVDGVGRICHHGEWMPTGIGGERNVWALRATTPGKTVDDHPFYPYQTRCRGSSIQGRGARLSSHADRLAELGAITVTRPRVCRLRPAHALPEEAERVLVHDSAHNPAAYAARLAGSPHARRRWLRLPYARLPHSFRSASDRALYLTDGHAFL